MFEKAPHMPEKESSSMEQKESPSTGQLETELKELTKQKEEGDEVAADLLKQLEALEVDPVSIEQAKEIFGKYFLGPEAVQATYGVELDSEELKEIQHIPFTRKELEQAKELGMILVLRVPRIGDGKAMRPFTINNIQKINPNILRVLDYYPPRDNAYEKDSFAAQATPLLGWSLVARIGLPVRGKNQKKTLKNWAQDNGISPQKIQHRTPVEIVYDALLNYNNNKEYLNYFLEQTDTRSDNNRFVYIGESNRMADLGSQSISFLIGTDAAGLERKIPSDGWGISPSLAPHFTSKG